CGQQVWLSKRLVPDRKERMLRISLQIETVAWQHDKHRPWLFKTFFVRPFCPNMPFQQPNVQGLNAKC
ncbi:MAG TPA: hypothetical protein VG649_04940, partial [Candidatus Angelobacter sp.]|nr:hypothetical protein [Candidatus Angelobacter sp.]